MNEMPRFIDRQDELNILNKLYQKDEFVFVPIYGRRRIGKTRLVQEFVRDKPFIYFMADTVSEREQLKALGAQVGAYFNDRILESAGFADWYQFFGYLKERAPKNLVLVIDEFPYLVGSQKAISSIFQKGIDQYLKQTGIFLILLGSSIGMMEKEVLLHKAPLYGRRTASLEVREMFFKELREFFPGKTDRELVQIYGVTGAVPAYLEKIDPGLDIFANIEREILPRETFLYNEVEYLLREEFREPRNYFVILRAIAHGKRKLSEIINDTGFEKTMAARYLDILRSLRLVEKETPVTEKYPEKSRLGLYKISDKFFSFWFRFIFTNRSRLEIGQSGQVAKKIEEEYNQYLGAVFEDICREYCAEMMAAGRISYTIVGRWWSRNEEIDIVALDEENSAICFAEAKWSDKPVGVNILDGLRRKAALVDWRAGKRSEKFILFSKSGFTEAAKALAAKDESVILYGL